MAKELEPDDKAGEKLDDKSLATDAHIDEIGALNGDGFSRVISIPVIADAKDDARSSARARRRSRACRGKYMGRRRMVSPD